MKLLLFSSHRIIHYPLIDPFCYQKSFLYFVEILPKNNGKINKITPSRQQNWKICKRHSSQMPRGVKLSPEHQVCERKFQSTTYHCWLDKWWRLVERIVKWYSWLSAEIHPRLWISITWHQHSRKITRHIVAFEMHQHLGLLLM